MTMRSPTLFAMALAAVALALVSDGSAWAVIPPAPGAETFPKTAVRLRYDMTLIGARIGQADIEVGPVQTLASGMPVRVVKTFARTVGTIRNLYSFENKITTVFNAHTYRPLRSDITTVRDGNTRLYKYRFKGTRFESDISGDDKPRKQQVHDVFEGTMGVPATVVWVAARALKVGETDSVPVHTGSKAYRLFVKGGEVEEVSVPAGTFRAVRVACALHDTQAEDAGDSEPKVSYTIWVTDDKHHSVVKFAAKVGVVGSVEFNLTGKRIETRPKGPAGPSIKGGPAAPSR